MGGKRSPPWKWRSLAGKKIRKACKSEEQHTRPLGQDVPVRMGREPSGPAALGWNRVRRGISIWISLEGHYLVYHNCQNHSATREDISSIQTQVLVSKSMFCFVFLNYSTLLSNMCALKKHLLAWQMGYQ
jgi:hypothetical protein